MAGLTLAQAEQRLSEWLSADSAVAKGQAYSLGGRTYTRADAREIRENLRYWQQWDFADWKAAAAGESRGKVPRYASFDRLRASPRLHVLLADH